ncbi:hypothetical protein [Nocardia sp. No.11]|uniref:hypothetical protein n=1 Tax=Nocardia sp. No.11 TaxID=3128861 RepID=UPI00319EA957
MSEWRFKTRQEEHEELITEAVRRAIEAGQLVAAPITLIKLTAWHGKPVYLDAHEVAVIEPVEPPPIAVPAEFEVAGTVVTLAAGRSIVVREESDEVYRRVRTTLAGEAVTE